MVVPPVFLFRKNETYIDSTTFFLISQVCNAIKKSKHFSRVDLKKEHPGLSDVLCFTIACARKFRLSFLAEFLAMIFDDSAVLGGDELCRILPREIKVAARVFADFSGKVGVIHAFAHGVRKRAEVVVDMNGIHAVLRSVGSVRAFYEKTCRSESRGFDFYKSEGVLNGREKEHIRARVNPSENFVAYVTRHNRFVFQSELFYFQFEIFDVITRTADYETESAAAFFASAKASREN